MPELPDSLAMGDTGMSRSGQEFVASTQGHAFTLYSAMRYLGIPFSKDQEEFQSYLERMYPAVVKQKEEEENVG